MTRRIRVARSGGGNSFAARASGSGVIRAFGFENPADLGVGSPSVTPVPVGYRFTSTTHERPVLDSVTAAEAGGTSIRFDIYNRIEYGTANDDAEHGYWWGNLSDDYSISIGENEDIYVQFRWRCNQAWIDTFLWEIDLLYTPRTITSITLTNPPTVTYTGTDPTTFFNNPIGTPGEQPMWAMLNITSGMPEINGQAFRIINLNTGAKTFQLEGVDATGFTAFGAGTFTTPFAQQGLKLAIFSQADAPGYEASSCQPIDFVFQTVQQFRMPQVYQSCGLYKPFTEFINGRNRYQNEIPTCGGPWDSPDTTGKITTIPGTFNGVFTPSDCFSLVADEWITMQLHLHLGPLTFMTDPQNTPDGDNWYYFNSTIEAWSARQGQPQVKWLDYSPTTVDSSEYFQVRAAYPGDPAQKLGKLWLLPYMTNKSNVQTHPLMQVWFDEVIMSREFIPDPP